MLLNVNNDIWVLKLECRHWELLIVEFLRDIQFLIAKCN
jgi:hypothetical protein